MNSKLMLLTLVYLFAVIHAASISKYGKLYTVYIYIGVNQYTCCMIILLHAATCLFCLCFGLDGKNLTFDDTDSSSANDDDKPRSEIRSDHRDEFGALNLSSSKEQRKKKAVKREKGKRKNANKKDCSHRSNHNECPDELRPTVASGRPTVASGRPTASSRPTTSSRPTVVSDDDFYLYG
jgi:hypothetical protein